jgi:hypothetical protein
MSQPIKVPKEIMELVYEKTACEALAETSGFFRALAYKLKAHKLEALIFRTMAKVFPQTAKGEWIIDSIAGIASEKVDPAPAKKTRKPRAPKAAADPANSLGE